MEGLETDLFKRQSDIGDVFTMMRKPGGDLSKSLKG